MKIKNEFSINLVKSNLNIYKIGNKIKINTVNYKPISKYIEIDYDIPKSNMSLVRNKTDKMSMYSYGITPFTSYYLIKDKIGYKINDVYKFNTKFEEEELDKTTLQFRKVESREEIEHRKKNINYKFKVLENEQSRKMDLKKLEKDLTILKMDFNKKSNLLFDTQKIERCIKNRVVVNFNDLLKLFPNHSENIKLCLQRLTFYFKGRYILKNKFYDKNLQNIRTQLLENFDINASKDMLNELYIKKNDRYYLKGYYEDEVIDFKNKDLVLILRKKYVFTLQDIKEFSGLEMEDVYKFIDVNNLLQIADNFYCVELTSEIEEVLALVEKESIKKGEVNEIIQSKGLIFEDFFKAFENYFVLKRSTWIKK